MLTLLADLTPASAVCLGVSAAGVVSIPALLCADAVAADFDPRPTVRRAIESGRFDPALIAVANAKHDARLAARDAAVTAAALLALLFPATGGTR